MDVVYEISTILMAKAFLIQNFMDLNNHAESIEYARNKAKQEGLGEDRIIFYSCIFY